MMFLILTDYQEPYQEKTAKFLMIFQLFCRIRNSIRKSDEFR